MRKAQDRTAEVRDFFKEREHADRIIQEVRDLTDGRRSFGPDAGEMADAVADTLLTNERFWEKLSEVVAACLKDKKARK